MLLEISDIQSFKVFFDVVCDSVSVMEFRLTDNSLKISLLNRGSTVFYDVEYSKTFFDDYIIDGELESVWVIADDLYKVLKSAKNNDTLVLESNENYLICTFQSNSGARRVFELPLASDYDDSPNPPNIPYSTTIEMGFDDLKQSSNDLDKIIGSKNMKFKYENEKLCILTGSDAMTNYVNEVDCPIESNVSSVEVSINVGYINDLLKFAKLNKVVELRIGNNVPLQYVLSTPMEDIVVTGLIAPLLEEME